MKKNVSQKKLSLNKIKITKPSQLNSIKGGGEALEENCRYPENGSKQKDTLVKV